MANAFLSLMHRIGHDDMDFFGDSTGEFPLSAPGESVDSKGAV